MFTKMHSCTNLSNTFWLECEFHVVMIIFQQFWTGQWKAASLVTEQKQTHIYNYMLIQLTFEN